MGLIQSFNDLKKEISHLSSSLDVAKTEIKVLEDQNYHLVFMVADLKSEIKNLEEQLKEWKVKCVQLEAENLEYSGIKARVGASYKSWHELGI